MLAQRLLVGIAHIEQMQLALFLIEQAAGAHDALAGVRAGFNFAELDAVTHVFYLMILARNEYQLATLVESAEVARAVDGFGVVRVERILRERRRGALGVVVVAKRERGAADADLARLARGSLGVILAQEHKAGVVKRCADGDGLCVAKLPVHLVVKRHSRRLRGAVEIYKPRSRAGILPQSELLYRKHLAAEAHGVQVLRAHFLKRAETGHYRERRRDPAQGVDPMLVQKFHRAQRRNEQALRHEIRR